MATFGALVARSLDTLLPPLCAGCGVEGAFLCRRCAAPLSARLDAPPGLPLGLPGDLPGPLLQLEWCAPFTGTVRAAIHALKYDGARALAQPLGTAAAARWRAAGRGGEALVPVPVHGERLRARGYDQAVLLAVAAGAALGLPVVPALARSSATAAQHALGRAARARNVGSRFDVAPAYEGRLAGRWLVLMDDVVTTGATLAACAGALLDAGAAAVSALTVAREG
jgi:ComF family protein